MISLPNSLKQQASQYKLDKIRRARDKTVGASADLNQLGEEAFFERYLIVQNKAGLLVPLQLNNVQRHLAVHLTGRDLVLKPRQVGISTYIQARQFRAQMRGNVRTSTLCHDDDLTSVMRRMSDRFYDNLPEAMRPERRYANAKLSTYPGLNSESSIATVGGSVGSKKGRGDSYTHLHGSESAFWPDAEAVLSAAMQAGNPEIVLESTPNGMAGWFYERCMEALDGNSIWTLHFYPWWWDDAYRLPLETGEVVAYNEEEQVLIAAHGLSAEQIKWRRNKQRELPHTFLQEYPEDPRSCFLASGNSYFGDIEGVFTAPAIAEPIPGRLYEAGLDFAQTTDFCTLIVLDTENLHMVDMLRINNLPWQEMRRQISVMASKWGAHVWAEANSMGTTNAELLQNGEFNADGSALYEPVNLSLWQTTAQSKPPLIQGIYHALHEAGLALQDIPALRHELRAFISKQLPSGAWAFEAGGGAHDDTVIALALAWYGVNHSSIGLLVW